MEVLWSPGRRDHIVSIKGHQLALMLQSGAVVWKRMRGFTELISLRTGGEVDREEGRDGGDREDQ